MSSLIKEIQRDCIDPSISTLVILRKLKAAAIKLDLAEVSEWVKNELEGYRRKYEDLPPSRQLRGDPKAFNPYHGWQPIFFGEGENAEDFARLATQVPLLQSVAEIEDLVSSSENGELFFQYPRHQEAIILKAIGRQLQIGSFISKSTMKGVLEDVRNRCLDFALELEQVGIFGENMAFTNEDKSKASNVTFNVSANSVGSVSNASDLASVNITNTVIDHISSPEKIGELATRIRESVAGLPVENQQQILELVDQLDVQKDDPEKAGGTLRTIKTVCEGAAGNVTAQGILGLLGFL